MVEARVKGKMDRAFEVGREALSPQGEKQWESGILQTPLWSVVLHERGVKKDEGIFHEDTRLYPSPLNTNDN